MKDISVLGVDI